jgi:light-regulated signal transduction histidine kinase (bacteriophytochrome)
VVAAVAFAFILPRIRLLPSPAQQRAALEKLVSQRTGEKDQLIREINHRVGNQLQIISSLVSIETRRTENDEALEILARLKVELDKMAHEHRERAKVDYLRYGVSVTDGTITPNSDGAPKAAAQSTPQTA